MEITYNKGKEEVKNIIIEEIKSHKKYDTYNEISGVMQEEKFTLSVESDIPVTAGSYFRNYFYGRITGNDRTCKITGRFSMKPLRIVLLIILFLICIETIVFNLVVQRPVVNIVPAIVILAAEVGLFIFQHINATKDKKIILCFLKNI